MFHASIIGGEGDAPSPIRLRALSLGRVCSRHEAIELSRGSARRGLICLA